MSEVALDSVLLDDYARLKALTEDILNSLPNLYYLLDKHGQIVKWNQKSCEVSGYSDDEHAGMNVLQLFDGEHVASVAQGMRRVFIDGHAAIEAELKTRCGNSIPFLFSGKRIIVNGVAYLSGLGVDLTERKALEMKLLTQANMDDLTGLPNRRHFTRVVEAQLSRQRRHGRPCSMVMIDVDHFKMINDGYGHQVGDLALKHIAAILAGAVRESDTAARIGGEEFAILLVDATDEMALEAAERIRQLIASSPMACTDGAHLPLSASFGVTSLADNDSNMDHLLHRADMALYDAKQSGRNRVCARFV
jgi:two-component system cell cycle response regulator